MEDQNESDQIDDQETLDRTLDAVLATKKPASTTDEIADVVGETTETTCSTLIELHEQGRIERLELHDSGVIWWAPRPLDDVVKSIDAETILKRLSDELETSISLGDGTVFENGDKHPPDELDPQSAFQNGTHSNDTNTGRVVPSSKESGEKRRELKDGADLEDVSE